MNACSTNVNVRGWQHRETIGGADYPVRCQQTTEEEEHTMRTGHRSNLQQWKTL